MKIYIIYPCLCVGVDLVVVAALAGVWLVVGDVLVVGVVDPVDLSVRAALALAFVWDLVVGDVLVVGVVDLSVGLALYALGSD